MRSACGRSPPIRSSYASLPSSLLFLPLLGSSVASGRLHTHTQGRKPDRLALAGVCRRWWQACCTCAQEPTTWSGGGAGRGRLLRGMPACTAAPQNTWQPNRHAARAVEPADAPPECSSMRGATTCLKSSCTKPSWADKVRKLRGRLAIDNWPICAARTEFGTAPAVGSLVNQSINQSINYI